MARTSFPPGFRFHPTDVELIMYYLKRKAMGKKFHFEAIAELNIYKFGPWDLPDKSLLKSKDLEWYFFCPREKKYASGIRTNRLTECGYWKTTGKDRSVLYNQRTVGMIKTLVFHKGHAPKGERTDWVMHEYRIEDTNLADVVQEYMLCKIFQKSGPGPKNAAQYGAPFNEEEWSSDVEEICYELSPVDALAPNHVLPSNMNNSAAVRLTVPGSSCSHSISKPGPSTAGPSNFDMSYDMPDLLEEDIGALLSDMLTEDGTILPIENSVAEKFNIANNDRSIKALPCWDGDENQIYNDLGDLNNWAELMDNGFNLSTNTHNPMLLGDDGLSFLELDDLDIPSPYRSLGGSCCEGEQETKPLSRLQLLLESISAQPASAAKLPAHLIRAEKLNDSISYYGSSIHFKAEVTLRVGECTKDALSVGLGESTCMWVYWGKMLIGDLRKKVTCC